MSQSRFEGDPRHESEGPMNPWSRSHDHLPYSEPLHVFLVDKGGNELLASFMGTDRTGMIHRFAKLASGCGLNFLSGTTDRQESEYTGSFFTLTGSREAISLIKKRVAENESKSLEGKRIIPEKWILVVFKGRDRPGILRDISGVLAERDINIVEERFSTKDDPEREPTVQDGETSWPLNLVMKFYCEVPSEQVPHLSSLKADLKQRVDKEAKVSVTDFVHNEFDDDDSSDSDFRLPENHLRSATTGASRKQRTVRPARRSALKRGASNMVSRKNNLPERALSVREIEWVRQTVNEFRRIHPERWSFDHISGSERARETVRRCLAVHRERQDAFLRELSQTDEGAFGVEEACRPNTKGRFACPEPVEARNFSELSFVGGC
jgi:glycine cleavage system regulatory protein